MTRRPHAHSLMCGRHVTGCPGLLLPPQSRHHCTQRAAPSWVTLPSIRGSKGRVPCSLGSSVSSFHRSLAITAPNAPHPAGSPFRPFEAPRVVPRALSASLCSLPLRLAATVLPFPDLPLPDRSEQSGRAPPTPLTAYPPPYLVIALACSWPHLAPPFATHPPPLSSELSTPLPSLFVRHEHAPLRPLLRRRRALLLRRCSASLPPPPPPPPPPRFRPCTFSTPTLPPFLFALSAFPLLFFFPLFLSSSSSSSSSLLPPLPAHRPPSSTVVPST